MHFQLSTPALSNPGTESTDSLLPHILVVEDSLTSVAVISRDLREYYTLLHARDGAAAWEMLQSDPRIELVITDVQMPRLTGQQLLILIRKSPVARIRNLPVIVMTTAEGGSEKHLAFLNGANDFLNKPVDSLELQARVNVHHRFARTIYELEASQAALAELATTDPLTKLKNRRLFYSQAEQNLMACRRYSKDMSLLLIDIDHFKKVNDTFGHHVGDEVLVKVASLISKMVRAIDMVARFGGEEFAVLLPETNRLGAAVLAERIRAAIERESIAAEGRNIHVTASIGVTTLAADEVEFIDQLLGVADRRLYLAKNNGRNRICVDDDGNTHFV